MIPRPEHPKPQFYRSSWMNLNGPWAFEIDNARSGIDRGLHRADARLAGQIIVPFCPESRLSGVEHKDFMLGVWYQRKVTLSPEQLTGRVFLHFGAVDYRCNIFVNGKKAGRHKGGYVSFAIEITNFVNPGENVITVFAEDDTRDPMIPSGKQSREYASNGCFYTRTTGIWQTVWLEFTPRDYISRVKYDTDIHAGRLILTAFLEGRGELKAQAFYEGAPMGSVTVENAQGTVTVTMELAQVHLWEPGHGRLYDLELTFGEDKVISYFGMRELQLDGFQFRINGKSVFQRLVLDQGYYPDGVYTAPTEEALEKDIHLGMDLGFNGARLHEKIFEERYLYHCDRLGYLAWGEYPNWGLDHTQSEAVFALLPEWLEQIRRDYNHPCIVTWVPFNENWDRAGHHQRNSVVRTVYLATKAADPSRPCIDASGHYHVQTDIYDVHCYEHDPAVFKAAYDRLETEGYLFDRMESANGPVWQRYTGGPVCVSEYGGIRWAKGQNDPVKRASWGYGTDVASVEEFIQRYKGLTDALLDNKCMFSLCYTQLTDVEQEENGLYTYDRQPKFPKEVLREIMTRKAAIEEE